MNFNEARKILGLGPDDDPRPFIEDFHKTRERIAEMVKNAPNPVLRDRYQNDLVEFDTALAGLREYLEALGLTSPANTPDQARVTDVKNTQGSHPRSSDAPPRRRRGMAGLLCLLVILAGSSGGGFLYYKNEQDKKENEVRIKDRITALERKGSLLLESRRWQEAARYYDEIESLAPGSEIAKSGRLSVEAGMNEEHTQFIGYWTGQAIAELEAGRLDEAQSAIRKVIEKFPMHRESSDILRKITAARAGQVREAVIAAACAQLNDRQWQDAINAAKKILITYPNDPDAMIILADSTTAMEKFNADQSKARELLEKAIARDQGRFDQQALDWLREASSLAPGDKNISERLEKMASYTRTLRVPDDFATPAEALAAAHDNDRIVLNEQTWKGPLVINASIELQGAGSTKTIIECPADAACAITITPNAKNVRVSGITFRHEAFHAVGADRFSAALVSGGHATFVDCGFNDASGHGLAVIENGQAIAKRCRFADNGWNGAAAIGKDCVLEIHDSESLNNFEHGIESWNGASVTLVNNRCEGNSRNGIHADNGEAGANIVDNQLIANREFGLVIDSAGSGKITGNTARGNLLGGLVIRAAAIALPVTGNQSTLNQGPGLVLEKGLSASSYTNNTLTKNADREILQDADLSNQETKNGN